MELLLLHFLLLIIALVLIYHYIILPIRSKQSIITNSHSDKPLQGPRGLPIIGNLHQFYSTKTPHLLLWRFSKKYSPLMLLKLGSREAIVISSARLAREALKTHDVAFSSRPSFVAQQRLSYEGLDIGFCPYGEYWREMRKVVALHLIGQRRVRTTLRPLLEDEVSRMLRHVSESSDLIDLSEAAMALSNRVICRAAFGKAYDEGGPEMRRFHRLVYEAQEILVGGSLVADFLPWFGWVDRVFTGKFDLLERIFEDLDSFYRELIDEHLSPHRPPSMDGDILDVLISLMEENSSNSVNLTWDHIKAMLMNVLIAGSDPPAAVIVWAMTALIKEERVMSKVQQEIRDLVGSKGKVDEEDIKQLPYFKAFLKETLRFYLPTPLLIPKEIISDCTIDGYRIKPKTIAIVNSWAISRDPECWEKPHEFCPERFLESNIDFRGQNFEFIRFGAGRRICPGISLGVSLVELAVANLVYAFNWELPDGVKKEDIDTSPSSGLTVHKNSPLCLIAKKV